MESDVILLISQIDFTFILFVRFESVFTLLILLC